MSEGMSSSWRYISSASSRVSSLSWDYINTARAKISSKAGNTSSAVNSQEEGRTGWRAWAGQKLRLRKGPEDEATRLSNETLNLFPGWAVRRYRKPYSGDVEGAFEVEVFVSGFAISHRSLKNASRSQRAFIRLAKGFASLPKITADAIEPQAVIRLSPSTEALLRHKDLPPRPDEITEEYVLERLERQLERVKTESPELCDTTSTSSTSSSNRGSPTSDDASKVVCQDVPEITIFNRGAGSSLPGETLRKLHDNLEQRLQPFWSSVLASRIVRIHLFGSPHHYTSPTEAEDEKEAIQEETSSYGPVGAQDVVTGVDGSFQARFLIKWEDLCHNPGALHIAFGNKLEEHDLLVAAQIQPVINTPLASSNLDSRSGSTGAAVIKRVQDTPVSQIKTLRIPISHSPIRVISDIDDTVKLSNILQGARAVFRNVFVKDLKENIIPGMGEWYTSLWDKGVRFHYVSNGPFELLPIVNEFFQISRLPPGSIRLKSYAGRSIFHGLLTAPATRKRAGVVDVLDSFPESRFILIGDTGEQDMELYAELARERPHQILAVFLRDVETGEPINDPTGWNALGVTGSKEDTMRPRGRRTRTLSNFLSASTLSQTTRNETNYNYFTSTPLTTEPEPAKSSAGPSPFACPPPSAYSHYSSCSPVPITHAPDGSVLSKSSTLSSTSSGSRMTEGEKRRSALQARVHLTRTLMPGHIPLRVFRDPGECVEAEEVLGR
ncbi:hypothetical protein C0993_008417 [Termitomyces sp. T159_Od127]|nr:hypothetical protein C0993_008417 [Termitomyces sp. T159_Od127]